MAYGSFGYDDQWIKDKYGPFALATVITLIIYPLFRKGVQDLINDIGKCVYLIDFQLFEMFARQELRKWPLDSVLQAIELLHNDLLLRPEVQLIWSKFNDRGFFWSQKDPTENKKILEEFKQFGFHVAEETPFGGKLILLANGNIGLCLENSTTTIVVTPRTGKQTDLLLPMSLIESAWQTWRPSGERDKKVHNVDSQLAFLIGVNTATGEEIQKLLWNYIKTNQLQNPEDERLFVPDARLATVAGVEGEEMNGFTMMKFVKNHILNGKEQKPESQT